MDETITSTNNDEPSSEAVASADTVKGLRGKFETFLGTLQRDETGQHLWIKPVRRADIGTAVDITPPRRSGSNHIVMQHDPEGTLHVGEFIPVGDSSIVDYTVKRYSLNPDGVGTVVRGTCRSSDMKLPHDPTDDRVVEDIGERFELRDLRNFPLRPASMEDLMPQPLTEAQADYVGYLLSQVESARQPVSSAA